MSKVIVITGSTRGIGFGLANEFLRMGCSVVVSGRSQSSVDKALEKLQKIHPIEKMAGCPCEVTDHAQVKVLWEAAQKAFDKVDIWINNAGISPVQKPLWEVDPDVMQQIIDVNVVGILYGMKVPMQGMLRQGFGQIYNMEGLGSQGRGAPGLSIYGGSKYALTYLSKAMRKEAKDTPVQICTISPGMVLTDLLLQHGKEDPESFEKTKKIFNVLADLPETVTPYLAKKVLENRKNGARIAWLTTGKIFFRFLTAGFRKRDLFAQLEEKQSS